MVTGRSGVPHPFPRPNPLSRGPTRYFNVHPGAEDFTLEDVKWLQYPLIPAIAACRRYPRNEGRAEQFPGPRTPEM